MGPVPVERSKGTPGDEPGPAAPAKTAGWADAVSTRRANEAVARDQGGSSAAERAAHSNHPESALPAPAQRAPGAKKGDLVFRCDFESGVLPSLRPGHLTMCLQRGDHRGNLNSADAVVPESEYDLMLRPDTNNPRYRVWFYFAVENVRQGQVVIFNIVNFSKTKSLYRDGMTPLVRSSSRPHWQRIPMRNTFYYKCPRHGMDYVLSFVFEFDEETDSYYFAYSFPYTYSQLQSYIHSLEHPRPPFLRRVLLGRTVLHRRIDALVIGADLLPNCAALAPGAWDASAAPNASAVAPERVASSAGAEGAAAGGRAAASAATAGAGAGGGKGGGRRAARARAPRRVVFVSARVHPGESPASYVCHGLVDFLMGPEPTARALRKAVTFVVVPMLNPDGVFLGNYRCSTSGLDLNRQWANPSASLDPENFKVKELLRALGADPGVSLDFVLDLHAHSTAMNAFCFVNLLDNDLAKMQLELVFLRLLAANCKMFSLNSSRVCCDPSKVGTGRRALPAVLEAHTHCYTLEVSFFCYHTLGTRPIPFTAQSYLQCGREVGATFLDYYKIPAER